MELAGSEQQGTHGEAQNVDLDRLLLCVWIPMRNVIHYEGDPSKDDPRASVYMKR